jgi:hypothetical protein
MANPMRNEQELLDQIKAEKIAVAPNIWDLLYHRIGDDLSAINLLCQYYLSHNASVPLLDAKKILVFTDDIKLIVKQITLDSKTDFTFPHLKDDIPLHPIIRELFTHYIGNDVHAINLIVGYRIDPNYEENIPPEDVQKIVNRSRAIKDFMDRLRQATT